MWIPHFSFLQSHLNISLTDEIPQFPCPRLQLSRVIHLSLNASELNVMFSPNWNITLKRNTRSLSFFTHKTPNVQFSNVNIQILPLPLTPTTPLCIFSSRWVPVSCVCERECVCAGYFSKIQREADVLYVHININVYFFNCSWTNTL